LALADLALRVLELGKAAYLTRSLRTAVATEETTLRQWLPELVALVVVDLACQGVLLELLERLARAMQVVLALQPRMQAAAAAQELLVKHLAQAAVVALVSNPASQE
jgi:hypothetical protein